MAQHFPILDALNPQGILLEKHACGCAGEAPAGATAAPVATNGLQDASIYG